MPFCFLIQNFAEIGESVDELWPKKRFSRWRPPPFWILKIAIFGHVTVMGFNICVVYQILSIEIAQFFTEIWWFSDLQNGGRPPSWILIICSLSCCLCWHADLLPCTKFHWNWTFGRWVMAKKTTFKMAAAIYFNFWLRDCHRVHYML